ncbi:MAG: tetratricopeptide repeat protein [Planctomycetaceae bacterium]|nr:tetratricopeptide repeat protein [Planctomycetaceae bacterium]
MTYFIDAISYLYLPLVVWMFIDCMRNDSERGIWAWLIIFVPGLGVSIYFFTRYLPRGNNGVLKSVFAQFQTKELKRLKMQSKQIGNAYHWIQYGDKLRELRRYDQAEQAYRAAMEKEPDNIQILWGLAICLEKQERTAESLEFVTQTLEQDPDYKFGDVSLAYARVLISISEWDKARNHLQSHTKRWRQPEGLYLYARCLLEQQENETAKEILEMLILDVEASPSAIARKQNTWKRKAKKLLRSI